MIHRRNAFPHVRQSSTRSMSPSTRLSRAGLQSLCTVLLLTGIAAQPARAQSPIWAEWTFGSATSASFIFAGGVNGTVELATTGCATNTEISDAASLSHGAAANYPATWYTPTPPDPASLLVMLAGGNCPDNGVVGTLTIEFDAPVTDPVVHFLNSDAAEYRFLGGVSLTRLSGNDVLTVVGANVNVPPRIASQAGCQANDGGNPTGACGSVRVNGTFTQLRAEFTDIDPGFSGDGHFFTLSIEGTAGVAIDKTATGPDPLQVGDTVEYSLRLTNPGNVGLSNVTVTDELAGISPIACPGDTLAPGAEMTCTATYTVTLEDANRGFVENTATVSGDPPGGPSVTAQDDAVVPPSQDPGIALEKSGSGPDPLVVGATIDYSFLVVNTGDVSLSDIVITDPLPGLSPIACPSTTLAPGAEMTCTATYEVTQSDVDAGVVENTATVTGQSPTGGPPPTASSTATVPPAPPVPSLPSLAFLLLVALLATSALWTLRRSRA